METALGELPYRHTQIGYASIIGLAIGSVMETVAFVRDLRARRRRAWLYLPSMALFAGLTYVFGTLTAEVREDEVEVYFSGGVGRRRIAVRDVTAAAVTITPWYAGWGIRLTRAGWLYNAWGRRAVELTLSGGRRFSIGTDEPDVLLAAIETARHRSAQHRSPDVPKPERSL